MAYDKVIDSSALEQDLTAVAEAIRTSGGTSDPLEFPKGYVEAVKSLINKEDYLADVLNCTVSEIVNEKVTIVPPYFQNKNANLTRIHLPNVTALQGYTVGTCSALTDVSFSSVKTIQASEFTYCTSLQSLYLPSLETITSWGYTFRGCSKLEKAYFPVLTNLTTRSFEDCRALTTLILGVDGVCALGDSTVFNNTPIKNGDGYVYVKGAWLDQYKEATNWIALPDIQYRAIEDYPEVLEGWE